MKKYSDQEVREAVAKSFNVTECMRRLGMKLAGGSHTHLSNRIKRLGLDTSHFSVGTRSGGSVNKKKPEDILVLVDSKDGLAKRTSGYLLRRALIESGVAYECSMAGCNVKGEWCGKTIILHVDHVNGDRYDSRPGNVRFLCPNCHSQTETYAGKSKGYEANPVKPINTSTKNKRDKAMKRDRSCIKCQEPITSTGKTGLCSTCVKVEQRKVDRPSEASLIEELKTSNYSALGRKYGVSDNAIRKWLR